MPKNGIEVTVKYLADLKKSICSRLDSTDVDRSWRTDYEKAAYSIEQILEQEGHAPGLTCVSEDVLDHIQSVAWNMSVTATVGRDISDRVPGAYALAN